MMRNKWIVKNRKAKENMKNLGYQFVATPFLFEFPHPVCGKTGNLARQTWQID